MWNYTEMEMYSASFGPSASAIASINQALAEIHLSMINHWGEVQRDIIRRCTSSVHSDEGVQQASFAAAADDRTSDLDDKTPEPDEQSVDEAAAPGDIDAAAGQTDEDRRGAEVSAVDEPVTRNAAMAILNNPALAAEAATRSANDAVDYEVRDDVADDIAAEIQREVRQELNPPDNRP